MSDHKYILMVIRCKKGSSAPTPDWASTSTLRKWKIGSLDLDRMQAAMMISSWPSLTPLLDDTDTEVERLGKMMSDICNSSMKKYSGPQPRNQVYWWSQEIADVRLKCIRKRRVYSRLRRKGTRADQLALENAYNEYRQTKKELKIMIYRAKDKARQELVEKLDGDRWDRPYKIVMGKVKPRAAPLTSSLDMDFVDRIVEKLFPPNPVEPQINNMTPRNRRQHLWRNLPSVLQY